MKDSPTFRSKILKYLEDVFNDTGLGAAPRREVFRYEFGISINYHALHPVIKYSLESALKEKPISATLKLISVIYNLISDHYSLNNSSLCGRSKSRKEFLEEYVDKVNHIFKEELTCYILDSDGSVRSYPDQEFHENVKSTLGKLKNPKYSTYLKEFNNILDELYQKHNHESVVASLFKLVELFILSKIGNKQYKQEKLDKKSARAFMENAYKKNPGYSKDYNEIFRNITETFFLWISSAHKCRHASPGQADYIMPSELFNYLLSEGISLFRFLLEIDFDEEADV